MSIVNILVAILIFSIVIIVHEFGHFLLAKANHIVVTEFALGLGPVLVSHTWGGTRYAIKLLPFGGSCSMLGEDEEDVQKGSFNSRSVGARISVILAGPAFNLILALFLAVIVTGLVGIDKAAVTKVEDDSTAYEAGLRKGDVVTSFDGTGISFSRELYTKLMLDGVPTDKFTLTVKRDGAKKDITYVPDSETKYMLGYEYTPDDKEAEVGNIMVGYPMQKSGIQAGDIIRAIDGTKIATGQDLADYFVDHPMDGSPIKITYESNGREKETSVTPKKSKEATLGFEYNFARHKTGALGTLAGALSEVKYQVKTVVKSLSMLVTGKFSVRDLSGPVGIVKYIGDTIDASRPDGGYYVFLNLMNFAILLSANLGVMNLLPFPALDGGRFWFLLVEGIRKKSINRKVEAMINFVGLMLLMALMVFVMFNDIRKLF